MVEIILLTKKTKKFSFVEKNAYMKTVDKIFSIENFY